MNAGLAWPDMLMDAGDPGHGYGLLSAKHLLDIVNEMLLVAPLLPALVAIGVGASSSRFARTILPGMVVAIGFLFLIKPALGMARDWDLMSFPILLVATWLLARRPHGRIIISPRLAAAALLSTMMPTVSFVGTNLSPEVGEQRFRSLIEYYGHFDDTGWAILTTYFLNTGQDETALELVNEMEMRGIRPEESAHVTARLLRKRGRLAEAERHYRRAIASGGFTPHLKNELGQLYMTQGRYRDAIDIFLQAHREAPRLTFIIEGLGLAYFRAGIRDTALMYADTLFTADSDSPGGHLLAMVIAIRQGAMGTARYHYQEYLEHGRHRSDYERMREYYGPILAD
jgi:tetratricopeptide (TPR) repeat protein